MNTVEDIKSSLAGQQEIEMRGHDCLDDNNKKDTAYRCSIMCIYVPINMKFCTIIM